MISIKERPRHLYVRTLSLHRDYPCRGFELERLMLSAELDDRSVDFTLSILIHRESGEFNVAFTEEIPPLPHKGTAYIVGDKDEIIKHIGAQLGIQRRSKKSDAAIMDWVILRVNEYVNSSIL